MGLAFQTITDREARFVLRLCRYLQLAGQLSVARLRTSQNLPLGIPPQLQRLLFNGLALPNESKISDHPIFHQSMLSLRWSNLDMESHMDGLTANE